MLSILLPVYNFDIRELVEALYQQCEQSGVPYEIIVQDDDSELAFKTINKTVNRLSQKVIYHSAQQNLGRAAIRNDLATKAKYAYLLFLDCDVKIIQPDFIQHYLTLLHDQPSATLVGGHTYHSQPPDDPTYYLHWYYGTTREVTPLKKRQALPYQSFKTVNFLIPADLFYQIRFEETLREYGHEDTLFGMALEQHHFTILHLDNPVEHLGLDTYEQFLCKNQQAIVNLVQLEKAGQSIETRLTKAFEQLQSWRGTKLYRLFFQWLQPYLERRFQQPQFNMIWLDLWKLGVYVAYRQSIDYHS